MLKKYANSRYIDDDEDDYDAYDSKKDKKKDVPPRFTKNCMSKIDTDQIVVNLSKTHYDIIETVVEELGWTVEHSKKSQKWDILWTDNHIDAQDLFRLNLHQKISHFPAIEVLSRKNFLGRSLMKMGRSFPQQYNFFPQTWSVPSQMGELMRYDSQHAEDDKQIYIFKPQSSSQGKGISLISNIQEIEGRTGIVQSYINDPYLIEGLKFDMRIYVLIYGMDPMRIYIYEQGLARFATETYQKAKKKNLKDNYIHLTNYAINKNNKKFIFNTSDKQMHIGHKRSLTSIFNILKRREVDVASIKKKIDSLIVKTLVVGKPMINHMYGLSQTDNLANDHCFHILGFDVMLDENLEPFLLEVNHTPSFATDTPLDKNIKKNLIKQTLLLLNVNIGTKKAKIEKKMDFDRKRAMRELVKLTPEEKAEQKKVIEKQKNAHEEETIKKYRKLYPLEGKQKDYMQIEQCAQKIFNEQYGIKNNMPKDKQVRDISSPVKNIKNRPSPSKQPGGQKQQQAEYKRRPHSIQQVNISSKIFNKIKSRVTSSAISSSVSAFPDQPDKLPDISLKRRISQKNTAPHAHKKFVKSYEFNPETLFAEYDDKINLQKIYLKNRVSQMKKDTPGSTQSQAFTDRQKIADKKEGTFIEPKMLNLSQNMTAFSQFDFIPENSKKSPIKVDKTKQKYFNDFNLLLSNQKDANFINTEKSSVIVKKEAQKRETVFRPPVRIQVGEPYREAEQLLLLKSLTSKPGNLM